MSLNKAIKHGREWRKEYHDVRRFDRSCRSHGGCPYCERSRLHKHRRREPVRDDDLDTGDVFTKCT